MMGRTGEGRQIHHPRRDSRHPVCITRSQTNQIYSQLTQNEFHEFLIIPHSLSRVENAFKQFNSKIIRYFPQFVGPAARETGWC